MARHISHPMLLLAGLCLLIQGPAQGQVMIDPDLAGWISEFIGPCPTAWQISPTEPRSSDIVSFTGPAKRFTNACLGEQFFGGDPGLMINGLDRVVELIFIPPTPAMCSLLLSPVCGLQGQFGPLKPGTWTFKCTHPQLTFEIRFNVDGVATTRDVIYVDADRLTLTPDGFSWETAFTSLQRALDVAEVNSLIKVAQGTYKPTSVSDRNASFSIPSGVKVVGGFRGVDDALGLKVLRPFVLANGPNPDDHDPEAFPTVLSGDLNGDDGEGFDAHHENSYHVVRLDWTDANTALECVTITGGFANGLDLDSTGGGLLAMGGEGLMRDCRFVRNGAVTGGGVCNRNFVGLYDRCIFEDNLAVSHGGAVSNFSGAPAFTNCLMVGNRVPGDVFLGGSAMSNTCTTLSLTNCTIADNEAMSGGALSFFGGPLWPHSSAQILSGILGNGGGEITIFDGSDIRVTYTDVQGGWSGTGNIDTDPLFVRHGSRDLHGIWQPGDYHLQGTSPCIDAGDPAFWTEGADIDGDPRILGGVVEMGADERLPLGPPPSL